MDQFSGHVSAAATSTGGDRLFVGDGEMARLMRANDWAASPLGPVDTWSPTLRMMVSFLLVNRFPLLLWWGPEFRQVYNDAYRPVLGSKHPKSLGQPASECFPEIWDIIGPLIESPFRGGQPTWSEDLALEINRHGFTEETHFTVAYSPVPDEMAPSGIGGVLATVHEISDKVVAERRVGALRDLGARSAETKSAEEACEIAAETLSHHSKDLPYALLYLVSPDGTQARLAATSGVERGSRRFAPEMIDLESDPEAQDGQSDVWPLAEVARNERMQVIRDVAARFADVPRGPWADPPHTAVVVPIRSHIPHQLAGFLVAGVSARLQFDDVYAGFFDLVSTQIATALSNARAYEEERKRAESLAAIDRAKTAFFSNVSHEFRTPLTLMLGPLEESLSAADEPLAPRQRERLLVMRRNGIRLLKLVNTLLDFSRIEAGRVQAAYELTDLTAYTAELASAFRSLVENAGLELVVDCPPLDNELREPVFVDRGMWEKVVLNLLSNAFKFTFTGAITVTMRAIEGGRAVELTVRDTGTGIPADELPRLFERFHRVEGARARTHEGSGIGLALVQELIHLHGGTIRAESAEGTGTTIFVRLPTGSAHLPADHVPPTRMPSMPSSAALGATAFIEEALRWLPDDLNAASLDGALAEGTGRDELGHATWPDAAKDNTGKAYRARVLLADDNADMRDYLRRLLASRYDVETASNGMQALAAAHAQPPDLVLSDVMMPEMDGFGLLNALRDDPRTRAIPVILLSARAGEEATIEGLEAGADDYLIKPFSAREVLSRVEARLEIARLRRAAEAHARELEATFQSITDGVAVCDTQGHILSANAAYRTMAARAIGMDHVTGPLDERAVRTQFLDPDGQPLTREQWPQSRILAGETLAGPTAADIAFDTPEGRLHFSVTGSPLRDADETITGIVLITRDVTERRRLELQTAAQANQLAAVFEGMADAVLVYGVDGRIIQANASGRALIAQCVPSEALDCTIAERVSLGILRNEHDRPLTQREVPAYRILHGETLIGERAMDLLIHTLDNSTLLLNVAGAPIRDAAGAITGAVCLYRDMAERRRLEREAIERASLLEAVFTSAPDRITIYDAEGTIVQLNPASREVAGSEQARNQARLNEVGRLYDLRKMNGVPFPKDELPVARALLGEKVSDVEIRMRDAAGNDQVILASAAPYFGDDGLVRGAVSVVRDITERRRLAGRTHEALDALLAMAEALVAAPGTDSSAEAAAASIKARQPVAHRMAELTRGVLGCSRVSVTALDGDDLLAHPVAVAGLSPEQEAQWWSEQLAHEPRPLGAGMHLDELQRLIAGEAVTFDLTRPPYQISNPFGATAILAAPMAIGDRMVGLLALDFLDASASAHVFTADEIRLALAVARLGAVVLERDRLLRERSAAQAREIALEVASRRMNEFLGIASHELRTPLTTITANVQMAAKLLRGLGHLPEGEPDDSLRGQLAKAEMLLERTNRQIGRMDQLVGDLLDVTRIQGGQIEMRMESCDLMEIVRDAVQGQRATWPRRVIILDQPRRAPVSIFADADRIGQVVTNYLTNALKYSREDQPVDVRIQEHGGVVRVEVRDHGPGLTKEQQLGLFERFYRVPGVEQQSGSGVGLGLGLFICKTIVERHGGAVGVTSAHSKGSTFWFTLPLARSA